MSRIILKVFKPDKLLMVVLLMTVLACYQMYNAATTHLEARYIQTMSWVLAGKIIVVDPGHGGIDPGAIGTSGTREKEITLTTAGRLATLLEQAGAKVVLTRQGDEDLSSPGTGSVAARKREDLAKRVALANDNDADFFIGIHLNSFGGRREHGAQTFSQPGREESWLLNQCIQAELVRVLKNTNRVSKNGDYFTTREVNMPAVIVEIGFISNPAEERLLLDPLYQDKVAWAIYSGIVKYCAGQTAPATVPGHSIMEQFSNPTSIPALKP